MLRAATVTATWNANSEADIAGYKLSYGTQTGVYTTMVDVGNVTSWPLTLAGGQRYYFAVQAYNTSAMASPYSAEVFFDVPMTPTPSITSLTPTSGPVGTSVTITGANFGATKGTSATHLQRHHRHADDVGGHQYRRARPSRGDHGQCCRDRRRRRQQRRAVHGDWIDAEHHEPDPRRVGRSARR